MQKKIVILGSTGSIGTQAIEVVEKNKNNLKIIAIAANKNVKLLLEQIEKIKPKFAVLTDLKAAEELRSYYRGNTTILAGEEGLCELVKLTEADIILTAMVGFCGLKPTIEAIKAKKTIALANKETLVAAGQLVMQLAKENNVRIIPVDSEHSAIFQCLQGENKESIKKLHLTASGGPFFGKTKDELKSVSLKQVLKHPNWVMGAKITVDSATLANKGLELIEARWLFDVPLERINVIVHRESIVHSMAEFVDGSVIAQMGMPDMKLPIQYALGLGERFNTQYTFLDLIKLGKLTFFEPDKQTFRALELAILAGKIGGTMPCIFNAANEVAVEALLQEKNNFLQIAETIESVMEKQIVQELKSLDTVFEADRKARFLAEEYINKKN